MKTKILILIFALTGATAMHTAQAETYDPLAVQRINDLIANNGLEAIPNAPETWDRFAIWNDETPKQIVELDLCRPCSGVHMEGNASFAGLTTLQTLNLDGNRLTKIDVTNCTQLQTLSCMNNGYISEIDLTGCIELESLNCVGNALLNLDLAALDKLTEFAGYDQHIYLTLRENEAGEYTLPISLNSPGLYCCSDYCDDYPYDCGIRYWEGILKSIYRTEGIYFFVGTGKQWFRLEGIMLLSYSVGIDSPKSIQLKTYPDPNTGELRIMNYGLRITSVEVFDINGRKQEIRNRKQETEREIIIDISHLPAGVYVVKVMTEQGGITQKIMKR